jgi:hypothetical protein
MLQSTLMLTTMYGMLGTACISVSFECRLLFCANEQLPVPVTQMHQQKLHDI